MKKLLYALLVLLPYSCGTKPSKTETPDIDQQEPYYQGPGSTSQPIQPSSPGTGGANTTTPPPTQANNPSPEIVSKGGGSSKQNTQNFKSEISKTSQDGSKQEDKLPQSYNRTKFDPEEELRKFRGQADLHNQNLEAQLNQSLAQKHKLQEEELAKDKKDSLDKAQKDLEMARKAKEGTIKKSEEHKNAVIKKLEEERVAAIKKLEEDYANSLKQEQEEQKRLKNNLIESDKKLKAQYDEKQKEVQSSFNSILKSLDLEYANKINTIKNINNIIEGTSAEKFTNLLDQKKSTTIIKEVGKFSIEGQENLSLTEMKDLKSALENAKNCSDQKITELKAMNENMLKDKSKLYDIDLMSRNTNQISSHEMIKRESISEIEKLEKVISKLEADSMSGPTKTALTSLYNSEIKRFEGAISNRDISSLRIIENELNSKINSINSKINYNTYIINQESDPSTTSLIHVTTIIKKHVAKSKSKKLELELSLFRDKLSILLKKIDALDPKRIGTLDPNGVD